MRKKSLLLSVLASIGVLVGGVGLAYAAGTFNAIQSGFRQGGDAEAGHVTMRVEAGTPDANSDFVPDDNNCSTAGPGGSDACTGGSLSFSITNTSDLPIRVTNMTVAMTCGGFANIACFGSNKNEDGTYPAPSDFPTGTCYKHLSLTPPKDFVNWPTIGPRSTLQVNGTDNSSLGSGLIHLDNVTPQGCQGALFSVGLLITATEQSRGGNAQFNFNP